MEATIIEFIVQNPWLMAAYISTMLAFTIINIFYGAKHKWTFALGLISTIMLYIILDYGASNNYTDVVNPLTKSIISATPIVGSLMPFLIAVNRTFLSKD